MSEKMIVGLYYFTQILFRRQQLKEESAEKILKAATVESSEIRRKNKINSELNEADEFWDNFLDCHPEQLNFVLRTMIDDFYFNMTYKICPEFLFYKYMTLVGRGETEPDYYKEKYHFMTDKFLSELKKFSPHFGFVLATKKDMIKSVFIKPSIFYIGSFIYVCITILFIYKMMYQTYTSHIPITVMVLVNLITLLFLLYQNICRRSAMANYDKWLLFMKTQNINIAIKRKIK